MLDQFSEIIYFVKGVIRNKWIITIVSWVVCLGGWVYVYKMPDIYEATARVHVDTRTMLRPLLRGMAIDSNVRGLVLIMQKLMFTQQNMLKVAELAGLNIESNDEKIHNLVQDLKSKVKIQGGRDELFNIITESESPIEAKNIVKAVLTVFSEQTQQSSLSDVDSAQRFIGNQIKEYEQRLRNAERAKENFKRENLGLLPGQAGAGQVGDIQIIREKIEEAKLQLSEMNSRKNVLNDQLDEAFDSGDEWGLTEVVEETVSSEVARITELQQRKDEVLLRYTNLHPTIISIDNLIQTLQNQNEEEEGELVDESDLSSSAMSNPYVQSIKMALNNIDAEIATVNSRIESFKEKLIKEDEQFNARLAIETEMQNLNRDYETIKKNYMALIDRREKARMSSSIDTQVSALKFKVVDPAHVPLTPSAPNRKLLYSLVLIIGFAIGTALALLTVFLRPTFIEAKHLRQITGLPVLGVVSEVVSEKKSKNNRYRLMTYSFVNVLLLMGYSGVMLLDVKF